jgi:DNA (cytosine-5)-methyltransferase 1
MAGSREKGWGKKKVFREGQAEQVLDDLFFDFIELARKLQPKVVVAENVKGMLQGNARGYVKQIIGLFNVAGYDVQLFLLNGATMGVPQKRERVFFVCSRKNLKLPRLKIGFNQKPVTLQEAIGHITDIEYLTENQRKLWERTPAGKSFSVAHPKGSYFGQQKASPSDVCPTLTAKSDCVYHWKERRQLNETEWRLIGSYPLDYKFKGQGKYMIGMSVPPLMTYGVANEIKKQWFNNGNA